MPLSSSLENALNEWLLDIKEQRLSDNTLASYHYAVDIFRGWLTEQPATYALKNLTVEVMTSYVKYLLGRKLAQGTVYAYVGILTRWLQDMVNQGHIGGIPNQRGRVLSPAGTRDALYRLLDRRDTPVAPRIPDLRRLPRYFDEALHSYLQGRGGLLPTPTEPVALRAYLNLLRNRALIATLFSTGGRINEVLSIDAAAVLKYGSITDTVQVTGKGRKRRPLRLDNDARRWIDAYLAARRASFGPADPLFISHGPNGAGQRLSDVSAWKAVKEAANALADLRMEEGAPPDEVAALRAVSPHSLRHFLAQAMLDEGADYKDITAILGHSSSVVTEQFYARLGEDRAIEIADTFAPRMEREFRAPSTQPSNHHDEDGD